MKKYNILWDEAGDGKQAVDMIKAAAMKPWCKGYSLILMDLNMPVMGGIEATSQIIHLKDNRELPRTIKVIAVTAFASESEKRKWYKAGMSEFIPKPFKIFDFVRLVSKL